MKNAFKTWALLAASMLAYAGAANAAPGVSIMAWGIKPTHLAAPYVNELRYGCHAAPDDCVGRYKPIARINAIAIAFAQAEAPKQNLEKARAFSALSERNPLLREIGIDDLVTVMRKLKTDAKDTYLEALIDATKSVNPQLQFGVTVYEDEIEAIKRDTSTFPKAAREKVDRVALYRHFRKDNVGYPAHVDEIRTLFPNAKVYGGVYHYDRLDYLRCRQLALGSCSKSDEIAAYRALLQVQISMVKEKKLDGLELYPGFLGEEASWPAWSNARICSQRRRSECIENSQAMTTETLQLFKQSW